MRIAVICVFAVIFGWSCSPAILDREAYASYVSNPENGFVKRQDFGAMAVEVFYQPLEYVYLKERKDQEISLQDFDAWKKDRENYEYYIVRLINRQVREIAEYKSSGFGDYAEKLDYLVSSFQEDINMVAEGDTIPCKLMHYERNYGLSGNNNFNVIFEKVKANEKTLMMDLSIFELGRVKFKFDAERTNTPKLSI